MGETSIPAVDNYPLAATLIEGSGDGPVVIFSSATAVPRTFYNKFAQYLVDRGAAAAVTYDYRGIADSSPARFRGFNARMRDWAFQDFTGVVEWVKARYPGRQIVGVGHSFGGQALGLIEPQDAFSRYAAVATISGHFMNLGNPYTMWATINLLGRPMTHLYGYAPQSRFGMPMPMPKHVFLEWANWCLKPGYFFDDPTMDAQARYLRYDRPLLSVRISDDIWGTVKATEGVIGRYHSAQIDRMVLTPEDAGGEAIGHLGFFKSRHESTLWPRVADWLLG